MESDAFRFSHFLSAGLNCVTRFIACREILHATFWQVYVPRKKKIEKKKVGEYEGAINSLSVKKNTFLLYHLDSKWSDHWTTL